jgi:hypothetical protein
LGKPESIFAHDWFAVQLALLHGDIGHTKVKIYAGSLGEAEENLLKQAIPRSLSLFKRDHEVTQDQ